MSFCRQQTSHPLVQASSTFSFFPWSLTATATPVSTTAYASRSAASHGSFCSSPGKRTRAERPPAFFLWDLFMTDRNLTPFFQNQPQRTRREHLNINHVSKNLFPPSLCTHSINLFIPSFNLSTLKLINNPTLFFVALR